MKTQLEAIRAIDPKAAEYIETEVLPRYGDKKLKEIFSEKKRWQFWKKKKAKRDILDLFFWQLTPQDRDYWFKIWRELNGTKTTD